MNKMKTWRTIWPDFCNVEIVKGVGQFPYHASKTGEYDSGIVCYDNEPLPLLKTIPGVKIITLKKRYGITIDVCRYLLKNAASIDVIHCFHVRSSKIIPLIIYKTINKKGKIWLDSDSNPRWLESFRRKKNGTLGERFDFFMDYCVIKLCDVVSAPTSICSRLIEQIWGLPRNSVKTIPYGYIDDNNKKSVFEKEKVFLCACRLGTYEKNVELLVNAFCQTKNQQDWKLVLVGSATKEFLLFLSEKKKKYDLDESRLEYKGELTDRCRLFDEYASSAVFVLPSRYESYGIVLLEALSRGCLLLTSDMLPLCCDLVKNTRIGYSFRNNKLSDLKKKMIEITELPIINKEDIEYRIKSVRKLKYPYIFRTIECYLNER